MNIGKLMRPVWKFTPLADFRREYRHDSWVSWNMGGVAICTGITFSWSPLKIPIPGHSTVHPVVVVTELFAMALGAKLHDILEL